MEPKVFDVKLTWVVTGKAVAYSEAQAERLFTSAQTFWTDGGLGVSRWPLNSSCELETTVAEPDAGLIANEDLAGLLENVEEDDLPEVDLDFSSTAGKAWLKGMDEAVAEDKEVDQAENVVLISVADAVELSDLSEEEFLEFLDRLLETPVRSVTEEALAWLTAGLPGTSLKLRAAKLFGGYLKTKTTTRLLYIARSKEENI